MKTTEENEEYISEARKTSGNRSRRAAARRRQRIKLFAAIVASIAILTLAISLLISPKDSGELGQIFEHTIKAPEEMPDWITEDLLPVNDYSRPGTELKKVNGVVVHYVGNPGTTAKQNRSYFANLADSHETYASSHFIIDTDGTIIQCVPLDEIAYCSNNRNDDTISIECCHLDESGEFTDAELQSLSKLLKWLIDVYDLDEEDIIRHYDVTGKICPKYFVDNPEEWESFRDSLFD
jgi:N-acetyl-anhydromuramyl-L-alanine amidase AmpD